MSLPTTYYHRQQAPWCWLLFWLGGIFLLLTWVITEPALEVLFAIVGVVMFVLGASFSHLAVTDWGDRLLIQFGPLPIFRRSVMYETIEQVEVGRTAMLDGWGIHYSCRGGWLWNLWGYDCVRLQLKGGVLRIGTDDANNLANFINTRLLEFQEMAHEC